MKTKKCCVFGHRKVTEKEAVTKQLEELLEHLIVQENVETFFVGSKSEFDDLCREVLAVKKEQYPHIKRIYVRAEYPDINEDYEKYLLKSCEKTYFPKKARNAGKAVYVERNYEMIDQSDICIVYWKNDYLPPNRTNHKRDVFRYQPKSGTKVAYDYAVRKNKLIINLAQCIKEIC